MRTGRKGDRIKKAFSAVPSDPTPIHVFANRYRVSVNVLRQNKRFNDTEWRIRTKRVKGVQMIWKEMPWRRYEP